jgi:hypothetical protein
VQIVREKGALVHFYIFSGKMIVQNLEDRGNVLVKLGKEEEGVAHPHRRRRPRRPQASKRKSK